jgi:DNA gyrase subunit A
LPTRIPVLLCNGCSGIAVGMATNIPSHNLRELIEATVAQIDNPEITVDELMEYVKGPDFPTRATIMGRAGIRSAYETGRGRIVIRSKAEIVENKDNRYSIVISEIPYQVNKIALVKSIADLVKDKRIEGISDIKDLSSDRAGIKIVIDLKRDANPQVVLNHLYKFTRLQDSFSINMLAIEDGRPVTLTLKSYLDSFIKFQKEIVTRRTSFDLEKAQARMHILEGLRIALENIDEVIKVIRNSYDDAKEKLMAKFGFSDIQAQSVLDMRLAQLQRLNGEKIDAEYEELKAKCEEYNEILSNEQKLLDTIKEELLEISEKYGDDRRTLIEADIDDVDYEDLIENEEVVITLTHFGYVKRLTTETYRSQKRGGKGISALSTREEDFVKNIFTCNTHDYLLFFTTLGRMYKIKAYRVPEASRQAKGSAIVNILPLMENEKVVTIVPLKEFEEGKFLTMVTKKGLVKKTDLMEYDTARKGGLYAIGINEDDELINVSLTDGSQEVFIATQKGKSIRFKETDVRPMGRTAHGVRGIDLADDDTVIGCEVVKDDANMLIVTKKGYGKITEIGQYKVQSRAGKGVKTYKITEKTGEIAGVISITDEDDVMMITSNGTIIRTAVAGINKMGRATQGVILMRLDNEETIVSLSKTEHEEATEGEESGETGAEEVKTEE